MAGHVTNPATKFEDPTTILSWVTSCNVFLWLPLKMRTRPLRMHRVTWPVSRGSKTITFLEFPTPICLFTNHYTTFIGLRRRLRVVYSRAVPCKPFSGHLAAILFYANFRWKLKIRLGNWAHRIQHASIMLKSLGSPLLPQNAPNIHNSKKCV